MKPLISIIIPVYNVKTYLQKCLDSIFAQHCDQIEVICIDDGSTDGSGDALDSYAAREPVLKVIHKENSGVSAARNDGIRQATGEYLLFVDSDDWLEEGSLHGLTERLSSNKVDILFSDHLVVSSSQSRLVSMFSCPFTTCNRSSIDDIQSAVFNMGPANYRNDEFSVKAGSAAPWHYVVSAKLVKDNEIWFNAKLKGLFDDGLFTLGILERADTVSYLPIVTYCYREMDSSLTQGFNPKIQEKFPLVYSELKHFIEQSSNKALSEAFYIRVFCYLLKAISSNYLNRANPKSESERYSSFLTMVNSEPYHEAISKMNITHLGLLRTKVLAIMLKLHFYKLFWLVKKAK